MEKSLRYYKGENDCPQNINNAGKRYIWEYEKRWCEMTKEENSEILASHTEEYISLPGLLYFSNDDGIPLTLKAMLFNRFSKGEYSMIRAIDPFKKWYETVYLSDDWEV